MQLLLQCKENKRFIFISIHRNDSDLSTLFCFHSLTYYLLLTSKVKEGLESSLKVLTHNNNNSSKEHFCNFIYRNEKQVSISFDCIEKIGADILKFSNVVRREDDTKPLHLLRRKRTIDRHKNWDFCLHRWAPSSGPPTYLPLSLSLSHHRCSPMSVFFNFFCFSRFTPNLLVQASKRRIAILAGFSHLCTYT